MAITNKLKKIIALLLAVTLSVTALSGSNLVFASSDNAVSITHQPQNTYVNVGDRAQFTVQAEGTELQYQWQLSNNNGSSWTASTAKGSQTTALSFPVTSYSYKLVYRCVITDAFGNTAASDTCRVFDNSGYTNIDIITQPASVEAAIGDRAAFNIKASGTGLTYQWQLSNNNGNSWTASTSKGSQTEAISFPVTGYSYKLIYRCVITDAFGNSVISNTCQAIEKQNYTPLQIAVQPVNTEVRIDSTASFTLSAIGTDLTYQWQLSTDNGATWITSTAKGNKTNTLSFPVIKYTYNRLYRCVVTDSIGDTIISDTVRVFEPQEKVFTLSNSDYDASFCGSDNDSVIDIHSFLKDAVLTSADAENNAAVKYSCNMTLNRTDLHILKLTVQAEKSCAKINITINNNAITATYPVYTQKADYYIPITNISNLNSIVISLITDYQAITISDFQLVNFSDDDITNHKIGIYPVDIKETVLEEKEAFGEASNASIADNEYLYSVNKGTLTVYDITQDTPSLAASLDGLGNCHDISFINNGNALVISARENGAYFVDIKDPLHPVLAAKYPTLEMSSGLAVNGSYAFICSRYFGVEIIDASDIYNPKYYSQISNKEEMYDCCTDGNYLYVGIWAQKKVIIYDISNLREPVQINTINLDGNVGGIVAENGILYAATGYHSRDNSAAVSSVGFGMGNGLEIYDVSNPKNPLWLSTSKIDGRYKYSGFDYWKVKVSGKYAVLASTYNGMYVYNIDNLSAPILINKSTIRIERNSPNYKKLVAGTFVFNFDKASFNQAPVMSVCTASDKLYFGAPNTGIYQMTLPNMTKESIPDNALSGSDKKALQVPTLAGYSSGIINTGDCVYRARCANHLIYLATSKGITVLDEDLNTISAYETKSPVKDIALSNDGQYLYTAECDDGLGIYTVDNAEIKPLGSCKNSGLYDFAITSITLNADENYIIAQGGFSRICTIDIKNKKHPVMNSMASGGSMYYRNICQGLIDGKYAAVCDNGKINLFEANSSNLSVVKTLTNTVGTETNGMAAYNEYIVAVYNNGYVYFNPMTESRTLSSLPLHKVSGISYLRGKPIIYDNIMVVSYCYGKEVTIIDISDLDNPKLISQLKIDASLDLAEMTDEFIIIPMRNDGIFVLKKEAQVAAYA
ncbi:MAG: hypothetical protein NC397_00740 [Clostridium sp.]|nr:hypothetical protein [Clostridium sp.]